MVRGVMVAGLIALASCGRAGAGANAPAPASEVLVVDAGAEPRRLIELEPELHAAEVAEYTNKTRMTNRFTNTVLEEGRSDADLPTIQTRVRFEPTAVMSGGEAEVSAEVVGIAVLDDVVDPGARAAIAGRLERLKHTRATWRQKRNGETSAFVATSELARAMQPTANTVMLPSVPVGVGAEWRRTSDVKVEGVAWKMVATYRLRELDDTRAVIEVVAALTAGSQALSVEPNATTTLKSGSMHISGTLTVPSHGVVIEGDGQSTSELDLLIVQGHLRITSTLTSDVMFGVKRVHM